MLLLTGKIGRAYLVRNFFVYVPEGRNSLHFFKLGAWLAGMLITFFRSERPHYAQRCFILKTHQMLSVHTTPEEVENLTITGHFWFMFAKNLVRELRFQPVLYLHEMKSRHFQIPLVWKAPVRKASISWRISVAVTLTTEIKLLFKFPPTWY